MQAGGHEFESRRLHEIEKREKGEKREKREKKLGWYRKSEYKKVFCIAISGVNRKREKVKK